MQADYIEPARIDHILAALMPPNELAMRISLSTGLRIDDVLSLRTAQIEKARITVREKKTGKTRRIYMPEYLRRWALRQAGRYYVFEHRTKQTQHRTRQAVYKDLKRAAAAFRTENKLNISPHSARKIYAVEAFKKSGDPAKVQELLNHSDPAVTMLYTMAEEITRRKLERRSLPKNRRQISDARFMELIEKRR